MHKRLGPTGHGLARQRMAHAIDQVGVAHVFVLQPPRKRPLPQSKLARRLRAAPATAHALLVAVTGYGQSQDRDASSQAGFDHHLVKPVDMTDLDRILTAAASGAAAAV